MQGCKSQFAIFEFFFCSQLEVNARANILLVTVQKPFIVLLAFCHLVTQNITPPVRFGRTFGCRRQFVFGYRVFRNLFGTLILYFFFFQAFSSRDKISKHYGLFIVVWMCLVFFRWFNVKKIFYPGINARRFDKIRFIEYCFQVIMCCNEHGQL